VTWVVLFGALSAQGRSIGPWCSELWAAYFLTSYEWNFAFASPKHLTNHSALALFALRIRDNDSNEFIMGSCVINN